MDNSNENNTKLRTLGAERVDSGVYKLIATNEHGQDEAEVLVVVCILGGPIVHGSNVPIYGSNVPNINALNTLTIHRWQLILNHGSNVLTKNHTWIRCRESYIRHLN